MPRFLKILRSHNKRRSNSSSSSPLKKRKSNGIFRTKDDNNIGKKSTAKTTPTIKAAITYSLSEDAESCDSILFPDSDIESQFHELKGESVIDDVFFQEPVNDKRNEVSKRVQPPARYQSLETIGATISFDLKDSPKGTKDDGKTMTFTFTHLEIMRNQLNHMMQVANKDKEIHQLKQADEDSKIKNAKLLASKDNEISEIKKVLEEVESALSQTENKLASADEEHSKTIGVLMETQYEYHELKSRSWMSPLLNYLQSNVEPK